MPDFQNLERSCYLHKPYSGSYSSSTGSSGYGSESTSTGSSKKYNYSSSPSSTSSSNYSGKSKDYSSSSSSSKYDTQNSYDDGYDEVYDDLDYDIDRYYEDDDYASGVDDAMGDLEEEGAIYESYLQDFTDAVFLPYFGQDGEQFN